MAKPRQAPERPIQQPEAERTRESSGPVGRDVRRRHPHTRAETTPRDVTGINPDKMTPIDPRMVYIPPA
jgi:hypothetical protein